MLLSRKLWELIDSYRLETKIKLEISYAYYKSVG